MSVVITAVTESWDFIDTLLSSPECPSHTMNSDQLCGYLRAIAAEPQAAQPADWLPLVFGGEFPCTIKGYSSDSIRNALLWFYNSQRAQVLEKRCDLGFCCEYSPEKNARIRAEQWARGFMQGYIFWQDIWSQFLDENQTGVNLAVILPSSIYDEIDDILATVSAVADADYALHSGRTIDELKQMFSRLSQKVIEYDRIAHIIRNSDKAQQAEK